MMPLHYMRFFFECCHQSSMPSHAPRQAMRCGRSHAPLGNTINGLAAQMKGVRL